MDNIFIKEHAEVPPQLPPMKRLGIYQSSENSSPKTKLGVVFDSSAKYKGLGICLNDMLMRGPDLTNNLVTVLTNFRRNRYAAIAELNKYFFFNFEVHEKHRNFLRFLWFEDNDPRKPLIEKACVNMYLEIPCPQQWRSTA